MVAYHCCTLKKNLIEDRVFIMKNIGGILLSAFLFVVLSRSSSIEFFLASLFYDDAHSFFIFKDNLLLEKIGHQGLKNFALGVWALLVFFLCRVLFLKKEVLWKTNLVYTVFFTLIATLTVSTIKSLTAHACPWDLVEFGGALHWYPLLNHRPFVEKLGQCWPGGHASGGFAFVAGFFGFHLVNRRISRGFLIFALVLGGIMSIVQQIRGAHFLSHHLWSLWFCWVVCFLGYMIWPWERQSMQF